ncbi:MAG: AMIN domain-containing protein, partial [Nitrospira sp.]|nr:AMIN domain-containing protein [Nitrospira sp.]
MKPLFFKAYALSTIGRLRFVWGVGLCAAIIGAFPGATFSSADPNTQEQEKGRLAQNQKTLHKSVAYAVTDIQIQPEGEQVTVTVSGDGLLYPEARMLDESRVVVDIPGAIPAVGKWVVAGNHPLLKRIRVGQHVDKVRLVFDVLDRPSFSLTHGETDFSVTLRPREVQLVNQEGKRTLGIERGEKANMRPAL